MAMRLFLYFQALFFLCISFFNAKPIEPQAVIGLSEGWAGNTVNTVIFRHHGIVTFGGYQFTAFYRDTANIILIQRELQTDKWHADTLKGNYRIGDAHNSISLGIDKKGYIHIAYDHHGHSLRYQVSDIPLNISEWGKPKPMTGLRETTVTYPAFVMNPMDSTLMFLYRDGGATNGQACMKIYDTDSETWSDMPNCILSGRNQKPWSSNPYWNHPAFDGMGKMHLSYVWRTRSVTKNEMSLINNIGIDYIATSDNGKSWLTVHGITATLPITQVNSETVWAVPVGANPINQTSMAVDGHGNPHIAYYANDENGITQYQHLWYDGKKWNNTVVSNRKNVFNLSGGGTLQIPFSRPEIVIDRKDIVHIILRADFTNDKMSVLTLYPPNYEFDEANIKVLWNEPLGYAEPIIDRTRWAKDNILSMLIQYNHQPDGDRDVEKSVSPIYIVDWDLSSVCK